jgi:hypothetical protein
MTSVAPEEFWGTNMGAAVAGTMLVVANAAMMAAQATEVILVIISIL